MNTTCPHCFVDISNWLHTEFHKYFHSRQTQVFEEKTLQDLYCPNCNEVLHITFQFVPEFTVKEYVE